MYGLKLLNKTRGTIMFGQELTNGTLTNYPTTLEELRVLLGEIAILPLAVDKVINSDVVKNNKWIYVEIGDKPQFNPLESYLQLTTPVKIKNRWLQNYEIIELSLEEKREKKQEYLSTYMTSITDKLIDHMEKKANELGYGNSKISGYLSICSYTNSTNPKFKQEAKSFEFWRDSIWSICEEVKLEVLSGKRTLPSYEELLTLLPDFVLINEVN